MDALTPKQFLEIYAGKKPEEIDIHESLKALKGSAEKLSDEEKEKRKDELEDMDSSGLSREFGLAS